MKKLAGLLAACLFVSSIGLAGIAFADDTSVVVGDKLEFAPGSEPIIVDNRLMLPLRAISEALDATDVDVLVDFTQPNVVAGNLSVALPRGVDCVVGTTGLSNETLEGLAASAAPGTGLFYAPNFTTGAVLMMEFAKAAAPYFPEAEVIEYHHCNKKDAPSGTAVRTAEIIAKARAPRVSEAPGRETEIAGAEGARGALIDGVPVHSVRSMGFVASQEVIFGSLGQTLTIRHDSWDRTSYMPGVLLGIRSVGERDGLIVGLENFMN